MNNRLQLSIKTPCSENFKQFSSTAKGGFCGSCHKEVIDFTTMNTSEIKTFFKNTATQNTCGRFNNNQLKTLKNKPKKNKRFNITRSIGLACFALFYNMTTYAQNLRKDIIPSQKDSKIETSKTKKNIEVKGTVISGDDSIPLPGVSVVLQGTNRGTQTNFDGYFEFPEKLKKGDVLILSFVGMSSKKIIIENKKSLSKIELNIDLKMTECIIMGEVAVKKLYESKKN